MLRPVPTANPEEECVSEEVMVVSDCNEIHSESPHDKSNLISYLDESESVKNITLHAVSSESEFASPFVSYLHFVPYTLEVSKPSLYPEVYLHFKKAFSGLSDENKVYCVKSFEDFKATYTGDEKDINASVARVEKTFERNLRECFDLKLNGYFADWVLNRACAEGKFREKLAQIPDPFTRKERMWKLRINCCRDIMPLVEFEMAYEKPDSFIWQQVIERFAFYFRTPERKECLDSIAEAWQLEPVSLREQIKGFVEDLEIEGFHSERIKKGFWDSDCGDFLFIVSFYLIVILFFTLCVCPYYYLIYKFTSQW